jgi:hypothetical protein
MELLRNLVNKITSNLKLYAILGLIIILGLFGFKACRKLQKKQDKDATSTVLTPDQKEKVTVDPIKHTITITKKNSDGSTTTTKNYLPDRPSEIIEDKNGKITVVVHKFGTEMRPYLGVGGAFDGTPRVHTGVDFFYYHRMDAGVGLDTNPSNLKDIRGNLNLSYNFYSNTSIACSYDNHKQVGLFLKVRF